MQSDKVGGMDGCDLMVVIYMYWCWALTTPALTGMLSLTQILLVIFVSYSKCVSSHVSNSADDITLIHHQATHFGVEHF
jgi:hypothetical protein